MFTTKKTTVELWYLKCLLIFKNFLFFIQILVRKFHKAHS